MALSGVVSASAVWFFVYLSCTEMKTDEENEINTIK